MPAWWPGFCLTYDVAAAGYLAWILRSRLPARPARGFSGKLIHTGGEAALAVALFGEDAGGEDDEARAARRRDALSLLTALPFELHVA